MLNNKKPIIGIDCDGVLADFTSKTLDILNNFKNTSYKYEDIKQWDFLRQFLDSEEEVKNFKNSLNDHSLFSILEPYPGTQKYIEELKKYGKIYIITSPMKEYDNWILHRDNWLLDNYDIKKDKIIHTRAKYRVHVDLFIDDKPSNVNKWKKQWPDGIGILFKHQGNKNCKGIWDYHTNNWQDIINIVKNINE